ncbi:ABC transporter permease [Nitrospirillum pindoramense]|uniref:Putative ABC transport system permease protein n=1 Tax=Nitrospirillum amazonense TaxID=28077 RepID=A0A560GYX5_9PROT|nr:FtsX-like permease family protein [Nitrospirillum amazonense]TWB39061.1 putative ABC transport system permease protein [Nitrospirillum amazonense]
MSGRTVIGGGLGPFGLSLAYLRQNRLATGLNLLLLALGVAAIAGLALIDNQMQGRLTRDVAGIDLVVGAKGSPLQLILSSVYQADVPTGNVPLSTLDDLRRNPLVKQAIPVAMGDSYHGFRIVGTTADYPAHYQAALAQGRMFATAMEATVGATVARSANLHVGDSFAGSHGLTPGGEVHAHTPYTVVGILAPTGTVVDRLVLTPVESVWAVHDHHHHHNDGDDDDHDADHDAPHSAEAGAQPPREVTAILVRYASPLAAARLPRAINSETGAQAASPAVELVRLMSLLGAGLDAFRAVGVLLVVTSALGTFVALTNALQQRRYDLAVMRSLGASRARIVIQIGVEALLVSGTGTVAGLVLAHGGIALFALLSPRARDFGLSPFTVVPADLGLLGLGIAVAAVAAALPAIQAYRTDVARTLARG